MKKNNSYILKSFVAVCIGYMLFASCGDYDSRLHFVNKTNDTLRYFWKIAPRNDSLIDSKDCDKVYVSSCSPNSEEVIPSVNGWTYEFWEHPDNILRFYIIKQDSLSKYGICKIIHRQLFIKRLDYTDREFSKANWRIVYDGK
jgi:hypothetical protein